MLFSCFKSLNRFFNEMLILSEGCAAHAEVEVVFIEMSDIIIMLTTVVNKSEAVSFIAA